ncbi:single-stranded-DNA-specific exonuclease RecJ [Lapidilactobacillus bayanensis]|uniref:single-stranded-DNA-specific exonuclease RecJ n=1 Tax=Lapidilactobacillus bayanensis TaxID=2485998 RepID=UPI000F79714B|nr:single-stranded-DNA-specific exonuclease RecJ [Lapidilactobacillus bayanensis]
MQEQWQKPQAVQPQLVTNLAAQLALPQSVLSILVARGYDTAEKITQFLDTDLADLTTPDHFYDLDKAVARIESAIEHNEKITVYGDYDADGVTSTSIMVEALATLGIEAAYYIPSRFTDGYGPNMDRYREIVADGTQLLITVDNGISGATEVAYAQSHGVDVIVTDHHDLPTELPAAFAVVHPRHPQSDCKFGYFAGAGVAFYLAWGLLGELPVELLDLVAIGTVADVMPLVADNRILVANGLQQMRTGERLGLVELAKQAKLDLQAVTAHDIGFKLAPRLNSLGRVKSGRPAVDLLTTFDDETAAKIAVETEQTNQQRQKLVQDVIDKVETQLATTTTPPALVIAGDNWAEGVLGIVASRLVDQYHCPTIVLSIDPETQQAKGSGRSVGEFDLFAALDDFRAQMINFGGHAGAVGLTVAADKVTALREHLRTKATQQETKVQATSRQQIDVVYTAANIDQLTVESVTAISEILEPYGEHNPEPIVALQDLHWQQWQAIGQTKQTLKGTFNNAIGGIAFHQGDLAAQLQTVNRVTTVGQLGLNHWQGKTTVQLQIEDFILPAVVKPVAQQTTVDLTTPAPKSAVKPSPDAELIDWRQKKFDQTIWQTPRQYVCFNTKLADQLAQRYTDSARITTLTQLAADHQDLLFVDLPTDIQLFTRYLSSTNARRIYLMFYTSPAMKERLQMQIPQLRNLLKEIYQQKTISVSELTQFAKHCRITVQQLRFGLSVFSELNFVKINKEQITAQPQMSKQQLSDSKTFMKQQALQKSYRELAVGDLTQIRTFLKSSQGR